MSSTFYGVLGVGPDADADAIRESYRERVKDVHPDVNDDPDADAQFQRLTTARDVLLDGAERARYDRLGHVSYVRHHVDCSAWTDAAPPRNSGSESQSADPVYWAGRTDDPSDVSNSDRARKERAAGRDAGPTTGRNTETTAGSGTGTTVGSGTGTNAGWATGPTAGRETGTARRGRESTRARADGATGADTGSGPASTSGGDRSNPWRSGSTAGTRSTDRRKSASANRRESASANQRETRHATGSYATSSFWEARSSAGTVEGRGAHPPSLLRRVARGLRLLGPWVIVHAVFLAAAVGTCLYVYSVVLADTTVSVPLLLVLVGEVVLAVVLSSIHVLSRLTR